MRDADGIDRIDNVIEPGDKLVNIGAVNRRHEGSVKGVDAAVGYPIGFMLDSLDSAGSLV